MRGCFSRAVDWKLLTESPAASVNNFRVDDHRIRVLDSDELRTVLAIDDPFVTLICRATIESLVPVSLSALDAFLLGRRPVRNAGAADRTLHHPLANILLQGWLMTVAALLGPLLAAPTPGPYGWQPEHSQMRFSLWDSPRRFDSSGS